MQIKGKKIRDNLTINTAADAGPDSTVVLANDILKEKSYILVLLIDSIDSNHP